MKTIFKRTIALVLSAAIFIVPAVPANAMTKKQVNKEISQLKKKIPANEKKLETARQKDADIMSGYTEVTGYLYCRDPFIITDSTSGKKIHLSDHSGLSINGDINDTNGNRTISVRGLIKVSDVTMTFNGSTIYEGKVVEAPHFATDLQTKIDSQKSRMKALQNSKNDSLLMNGTVMKKGTSVKLAYTLHYGTDGINTIKWTSSNKKVVKISKNGTLTALKTGTATISGKLSVTGKTYKCTVIVEK